MLAARNIHYDISDRDGLAGLIEGEVGYFGIYWFVAETNNGGLDQFFCNDSNQLALPAGRYLQQIGATRPASILRSAIELFPNGKVPISQEERRAVHEAMDNREVSFGPLTDELFACGEDASELQDAHVRAYSDLFARFRDGG